MEAAVTINSQQDKRSRQNGGQTEKHRKERVAMFTVIPNAALALMRRGIVLRFDMV